MNPYLLYSSLTLYTVGGFLYLLQLIFTRVRFMGLALRLTQVAFVLQSVLLGIHFYRVGYPFIVEDEAAYLFTAWTIALVFLLIQLKSRLSILGALVLPGISTFYLLALFSRKTYIDDTPGLASPWASVHIMLSFLALAIFSLSFILAIVFIFQEFQLKYKVLPKVFLRLPNLEILETAHAKALSVGFILLTGGIITGAGWAKSVTGFYFFEDARQLWSIAAWLIYALFLQARFTSGLRGRRGVLLSLLGFVVVLFTFLGVEH